MDAWSWPSVCGHTPAYAIERSVTCADSKAMVFVSITRLRIRSLRFMPRFVIHAVGSVRQTRQADGFVAGSLLRDRKRTFWTMTVWRDQAAMRAFMSSGAHLRAMPKLLDWCDEASVAHWTQSETTPPDWATADARMRAEGRPSKVRHPSPNHNQLAYDPPRSGAGAPIRSVRPG